MKKVKKSLDFVLDYGFSRRKKNLTALVVGAQKRGFSDF